MTVGSVLEQALASIDRANREDPNTIDFRGRSWPLAELQGVRASFWLGHLKAEAPVAVQLGARAHHLRRWTVARSDFAEGRVGYHQWKRAVTEVHAQTLASLELGVSSADLARAQALVRREGLGTDPDTQLIEDCACLVFLETQFEGLISKLGRDKVVGALRKTLKKMSPEAIGLSAMALGSDRGSNSMHRSDSMHAVLSAAVELNGSDA